MKQVEFIIIGGSAGSLHVILNIIAGLPANFRIPVLVIIHRNSTFDSSLEELFASRTKLPIKEVEEKESILPGTIYTCPSDYHLLFENDRTFSLDYSERINFSRPSIDVSFRSAAEVFGPNLVCCLLSGGNADGVDGLAAVRDAGGMTIVQDPATADVPYMPQHAVSNVEIDHIIPSDELPYFIASLSAL
jgi:two-component system chemotaxis response regulator CheB